MLVSISETSGPIMKVSHDYLASSYHAGIVSGFTLVSSYLKKSESSGKMVSIIHFGHLVLDKFMVQLLCFFLPCTDPAMFLMLYRLRLL